MRTNHRSALGLLILLLVFSWLGMGCTGIDADNASERPWNEPKGYGGGILGSGRPNR